MTKICIVTACGNKKHEIPKPAWKIYKSSRIKAVYNRRNNHDMYILSAEHGLLPSEKIIQPYNRIMDEQRSKELISDMVPIIQKYDTVIFFKAGARKLYEQCIESACKKADKKIISFGYAIMGDINKLPEIIRDASRDTQPMPDNCKILHELLERLPLIKYPFDADRLPDNGIYFFYEHGEFQAHTSKPRIVRVGTHNQNNFKPRIRNHYVSDSKMNFDSNRSPPHDRSIFRKNIGRAILNKENNPYLGTWNIDFTTRTNREKYSHLRDTALEKRTEIKVSEQLRRNFSFRFIILETEEERKGTSGMESRLIGTLSRCQICSLSDLWLGKHSPVEKIRTSGLWLVQHLNSKELTEDDMEKLSQCVDQTRNWIENKTVRKT